jgi:hypothetical protein
VLPPSLDLLAGIGLNRPTLARKVIHDVEQARRPPGLE